MPFTNADLATIEQNVEKDKYPTLESFDESIDLIFRNCRTYNNEGSSYVKCANRLEKYYRERTRILKAEMVGQLPT